jgi:hypothetical protein
MINNSDKNTEIMKGNINMKRIISLLLTAIIVLSVFSVFSVSAADSVLSISGADKYEKTYGDKAFSLNLTSNTEKTDANLTYSSADNSVAAVDKSGKVSVKGCGQTTITAKTSLFDPQGFLEGNAYTTATKAITVKVKPGQVKFKVKKSYDKKQKRKVVNLMLTKQKNCDKYIIHISSNKKFKKNNRGENTYSGKISKITLKPPKGKKFYARVRAYKKGVGYGDWSKPTPYKV